MWNKFAEQIVEWLGNGRIGRVVGTASGLFLGFVYLIWGFWDMLVFAFVVLAGFWLGKKTDNREKWVDINTIARWFSDRRFR